MDWLQLDLFSHASTLVATGKFIMTAEGGLHNFASQGLGGTVMLHKTKQFTCSALPNTALATPRRLVPVWERAAWAKCGQPGRERKGLHQPTVLPREV